LGGMDSQDHGDRRERITKNCLSVAYDDQQAGLVRHMTKLLDSIYNLSEAAL
jgi:hypothetical protein